MAGLPHGSNWSQRTVVGQFGFNSDRGARVAEQNEDQDDRDANGNADQHLDDQRPHGEILTIRR